MTDFESVIIPASFILPSGFESVIHYFRSNKIFLFVLPLNRLFSAVSLPLQPTLTLIVGYLRL